jgi:hypothetical protein
MAAEDALAALTQHWDDVIARLDAARAQQLKDLIDAIGGPRHRAALFQLTQLLEAELPPEHPVRRELSAGYLLTSTAANWLALRGDLLAVAGAALLTAGPAGPDSAPGDPPGTAGDGAETPEGLLAEVTGRLLNAPALSEDEVRRRGGDPADPGLLRLDRSDGAQQWPSFQFARDGGPIPVVQAVNILLAAETDPLGVADWWLGVNPWLDGRPCDLIGDIPDERLLRAARAVTEEV